MTPDEIQQDTFVGRGDALLALLQHDDPEVRSAAAVRIADLYADETVGLPRGPALFAALAHHDAVHPGVADAFWATAQWGFFSFEPEISREEFKAWLLTVLLARAGEQPDCPVPGNDLEFHAHEALDEDADALTRLLAHDLDSVVLMALDHGALPREPTITLLHALIARGHPLHACLAINHGIIPADPPWPLIQLGDHAAHHITSDHATRHLWTVHWLLPSTPARVPLDPAALLTTLQTILSLDPDEATLDPAQIHHIAFPDLPAARRLVFHPRRDLQLDLALDESDRVLALRIVRAREPLPTA